MVRRRVAAGVGVALLIVIVLLVNGCLKNQKTQALREYGHNVSRIVEEANQKVSKPLFAELAGASSKSALDVETEIDQLHLEAQQLASQAKGLSVPSEMDAAQRNLTLSLNLQAEGVAKVGNQVRAALGGQAQQASALIAGAMENFLASDVISSQRVTPLIEEALHSGGAQGQTVVTSRFLPNIGWLEPSTVQARLGGQSSSSQSGQVTAGTHGSALLGVSVGGTELASEPTLNHIGGGSSPTFAVSVEDSGENTQTNVKVEVTVIAEGKQLKGSGTIPTVQAGQKTSVNVPVANVPTGVAAKIEAYVVPVPGETSTENNKGTYLAIFSG
jgi:hypothetical protein